MLALMATEAHDSYFFLRFNSLELGEIRISLINFYIKELEHGGNSPKRKRSIFSFPMASKPFRLSKRKQILALRLIKLYFKIVL